MQVCGVGNTMLCIYVMCVMYEWYLTMCSVKHCVVLVYVCLILCVFIDIDVCPRTGLASR